MKVREYRSEDWKEVVKLFHDTIHSVNSAVYTATVFKTSQLTLPSRQSLFGKERLFCYAKAECRVQRSIFC